MLLTIDRRSKKPIFKQIVNQIHQKILSGELAPNSRMLSERELAKTLSVNRMTVVRSYDELQSLGLIERFKGSGTFVAVAHKRDVSKLTNWTTYINDNTFLTTNPIIQKIREHSRTMTNGFDLANGELAPDLFPSNLLEAIMRRISISDINLGYSPPEGIGDLRDSLCLSLDSRKSIKTTSACILITSGAQQALYLIANCLLRPGDVIAIESPSYNYSLSIFKSAGLKIVGLKVKKDGIDPKEIEHLYKSYNIKMIFLNPTYQNPTGTVMSSKKRIEVLRISERLRIPIVEDDPFSDLNYGTKALPPPIKSYDDKENVLYIGSFSKIVASGLRIGWLVAPIEVIKKLSDVRQQIDFGLSIFPQIIANEFVKSESYTQHIELVNDLLRFKRDILVTAMNRELKHLVQYQEPNGGFHLWVKLNNKYNESKLINESFNNNLLFMPGSIYGDKNGYFRLTFARLNNQDIDNAIEKLKLIIEKAT
ncbi:hypothetical protein DH09_00875 (plasmid) [Bacillaceae bacterium JMAK1]|nr:hypothetical protein DH09_00875 [Bacillaceae bacterium JMAK1]